MMVVLARRARGGRPAPRDRSAGRWTCSCCSRCAGAPTPLLVGPATVRAEGYGPLPCPAVLVSRSFDLPWEAGLFAGARAVACSIYTQRGGRRRRRSRPRSRWCRSSSSRRCSPTCAGAGSSPLLCEGGPRLNRALLAAGLLDELFLTLSPLVTGDETAARRSWRAGRCPSPRGSRCASVATADGELYLRYSV